MSTLYITGESRGPHFPNFVKSFADGKTVPERGVVRAA